MFAPITFTLDLGTRTGWAYGQAGTIIKSGVWELASDKDLRLQRKEGYQRFHDIRITTFFKLLSLFQQKNVIQRVVFEDVMFAKSLAQIQLWSSFRGVLWSAFSPEYYELKSIHTGTLKRFATGSGSADKEQMILSLNELEDDTLYEDDNETDAVWLLKYAFAVDAGSEAFLSPANRRREDKRRAKERSKNKRARSKKKLRELEKRVLKNEHS